MTTRLLAWLTIVALLVQTALMIASRVVDDRSRHFVTTWLGSLYAPAYAVALLLSRNVHDPSLPAYFVAATIETLLVLVVLAYAVKAVARWRRHPR